MKRRYIAVTAMLSTAMMMCSGCAKSDDKRVEQYLEKKYGESFTVVDSRTSGDGRTPFSYSLTAYCAPTSHPECMFITQVNGLGSTDRNVFRDFYGTGILNVRLADEMAQKLSSHFGTIFVTADLNRTSSQILPDMQEIEYFTYFDMTPESEPDHKSEIVYSIAINESVSQSTDPGEEYDAFLSALSEMAKKYRINSEMDIYFMPDETYQAYSGLKSRTLAPFSYSDYPYSFERIAYSAETEKVTAGFNQDEPKTKEAYQKSRTEKHNE